MITGVIIDDEVGVRSLITKITKKYCPNLDVVGEAESVEEGHALILEKSPEVIFLDIRMGDGTGFDLLNKFDAIDFEVIFITAYDQYAINAIKFCALDYLLKPVSIDELVNAVNKAAESINSKDKDSRIEQMLFNLSNSNTDQAKIGVPFNNGIEFIKVNDIIRCEADGSYTNFHLTDGTKMLVTGKMKQFEELLEGYNFLRVHNSHLINLSKIKRYMKGEGGTVIMEDTAEIPVSRSKKNVFLEALK